MLWERCVGTMPDEPPKKHGRKREKHPAGKDWTDRKLDEISNADVRTLHAEIGSHTPILANRVVELISTVYNRAVEWGYPGPNPATGIEPFAENERDRFIQADELPKFFKALEADTSTDFKHFVLLCLLTGARRKNVLEAKWADINLPPPPGASLLLIRRTSSRCCCHWHRKPSRYSRPGSLLTTKRINPRSYSLPSRNRDT
jgi:integrase